MSEPSPPTAGPCPACEATKPGRVGADPECDPTYEDWAETHGKLAHALLADLQAVREERDRLLAYRLSIQHAYQYAKTGGPGGKPMSPFFFGQRLRRTVREAEAALARSQSSGRNEGTAVEPALGIPTRKGPEDTPAPEAKGGR